MRTRNVCAIAVGLVGIVSLAAIGCRQSESSAPTTTTLTRGVSVARGEYLVTVVGCNDCHTPYQLGPQGPEPDMTRMLSGHPEDVVLPEPVLVPGSPWSVLMAETNTAFAGPWGISYAANLTPDPSGLIAWDEEIFLNALRTGRHWGVSRPILPPMPWPWFSKMTDEDLKSIFAYLQTIPPVSNHVPEPMIIEPSEI